MNFCDDHSLNIVIGKEEDKIIKSLFLDWNTEKLKVLLSQDPTTIICTLKPIDDFQNIEEPINFLPENIRLPQLLKEANIFTSTSAARSNGFDKDIPIGWSEISFKKKGIKIFIWKSGNK